MIVYFFADDPAAAVTAVLHRGVSNDAEQQSYVDAILRFNEQHGDKAAPVFVLIDDRDGGAPDAKWRKRIAEASGSTSPRALVTFVFSSQLARGIVTAVNWLRPAPYRFTVTSTIEEAITWLEPLRPGVRAPLQRLHRQLLETADARAVQGRRG